MKSDVRLDVTRQVDEHLLLEDLDRLVVAPVQHEDPGRGGVALAVMVGVDDVAHLSLLVFVADQEEQHLTDEDVARNPAAATVVVVDQERLPGEAATEATDSVTAIRLPGPRIDAGVVPRHADPREAGLPVHTRSAAGAAVVRHEHNKGVGGAFHSAVNEALRRT